ncbi:MAG: transpeptidase family protein [Spirochaetales bacterium]|jgi:cell division protein FtsI (penicillin-binding protein 3)|nr:transpeptidase family protein [Spirochaetales bacterium]
MNNREKNIDRRFLLVVIFSLLFCLLLLARYFAVMVMDGASPPDSPGRPPIERGPILDRSGRILAIQSELDSVEAWIPFITDKEAAARDLGELLNLNPENLLHSFQTRSASLWIKRKITPTESERINEYLQNSGTGGIYIRKEFSRNYPQQRLASHLLGYAGTDNRGLEGIEYAMDSVLTPEERLTPTDQIHGNQLFLTIDANIQFMAEELAHGAYGEHNPDWVTLLVMDAENGDVLAYVGMPDFDPNNFQAYTESERLNRPVVTAYEPGSVFKVFSVASFLDMGILDPGETFLCTGSYASPDFAGAITCLRPHGLVTPGDIIKYSCNVGTALISERVSREELYSYLTAFGFGGSTQLPLPGESNGLLRNPQGWSARSKPTIAFGQELLVSTIQIAAAATVFTNQGVLLKPHVVDRILTPGGSLIVDYQREPVRQVIQPSTAALMLEMMETAVAPGGTASRMATPGIRIAAKTGTAQLIDPRTGRYSDAVFGASALAIFPVEAPRFILYLNIENPKGSSIFGAVIAVPVLKQLIDELVVYAGIPRSGDRQTLHPGVVQVPANPAITLGETIPDLSGRSKRELLPLLLDSRIRVRLNGEGWVVRQSPPPGTPVETGMTLELEFE